MCKDEALRPAPLLFPKADKYFDRPFQGIASLAGTREHDFLCFYAGGVAEGGENYVLYFRSPKGQDRFSPFLAIDPPGQVRAYDSVPWVDDQGRLWLFWAQSYTWFDGRCGVFCACSEDPDAPQPHFSVPRRIGDGIMMNKPTVLQNGTWLLPIGLWACETSPLNQLPEPEHRSFVYASRDRGKSFQRLGGADVPNRCFDEHLVIERRDGSLWMLVRRFDGIGESFSYDGGLSWTPGQKSRLPGVNSRFFVRRLADGSLLQVNHVDTDRRSHLTALLSLDDGKTWPYRLLLDERDDISYPDGYQDAGGVIHIVHDRERTGCREILLSSFTVEDIRRGRAEDPSRLCRVVIRGNQALWP